MDTNTQKTFRECLEIAATGYFGGQKWTGLNVDEATKEFVQRVEGQYEKAGLGLNASPPDLDRVHLGALLYFEDNRWPQVNPATEAEVLTDRVRGVLAGQGYEMPKAKSQGAAGTGENRHGW